MKLRIAFAVCLALAAVPAVADTIYDNGAISGVSNSWTINYGFAVSDTFLVGSGGAAITGLDFGAWVWPGDTLQTVEVSITSAEFGGTTYFDGLVNFTQSGCSINFFGFYVCNESGAFDGPTLSGGTYWLNLQNAVTVAGNPIYWDENSGPSLASNDSEGTIPSEAFTLLGTSSGTGGGTVPEPSSIMLLGSGILGLVSLLRRKRF